MRKSQRMVAIILTVIGIGFSLYLVSPEILSQAQQEEKTFVTHSGEIIKTSGEILDPVYAATTVDFEPDIFLREFKI